MKRILILFALLIMTVVGMAQAPSNYTNINGRYRWIAGMFDSTFSIPKGATPSLRTGGSTNPGAIFYRTSDSSLYIYTGTQWLKQAGTSGFVPYVGATQDVDLDTWSAYAKSFHIKGTGGQGHLGLKFQSGIPNMSVNESGVYADANGNLGIKIDNAHTSIFKTSLNTADRTYTLENKSYTIGDSADIAARVKYTDTASMLSPYLRKVDTASLSNRINLKVNISDTASMLSPYAQTNAVNAGLALKVNISDTSSMLTPYLRKVDTASLSNRINLKVNISDTSSMLGNYINNVGYGLARTGQVVRADSATLSNYYLRRKDSLTATNLLGYVTKQVLADTASAIRGADAGGTVKSVATNTATGITGGTITTSGTLAIDTLLISTRAWRQKGVDSLQANINGKVNISDTATMLSPYLRSNVASATYVPQTRTITINGTSQDLSANRTYNVGTVTSVATSTGTGITGGTITSSGTIAADTTLLSTRLWRQKGIDSVQGNLTSGLALKVNISDTSSMLSPYLRKVDTASLSNRINLKVNISDTSSMLSPYFRTAGIGLKSTGQTVYADTLLLSTRAWRQKGIDSVAALVSGAVSGTTNYIPKFTSSSAIGNSVAYDNGGELLINTTSDAGAYKLQVDGAGYFSSSVSAAGSFLSSSSNNKTVFNTSGVTTGYQLFALTGGNSSLYMGVENSTGDGIGITGTSPYSVFFGSTDAKSVQLFSSSAVRMTITSGGNVNIGGNYTSTTNTLQVTGNAAIGYTSAAPSSGLIVSGNVGIGTSSPNAKLDVSGTLRVTDGVYQIYEASATRGGFYPYNRVAGTGTDYNPTIYSEGNLYFIINGTATKAMTLNANSELLINTTSDAGDYKLQVTGNIYGSGNLTAANVIGTTSVSVKSGNGLILYNTGNTNYFQIYTDASNILNFGYGGTYPKATLSSGGNLELIGSIKTAAPTSGTAKTWLLGEAATVSPTSPNRTIRVEIDGVVYYIAAKTTND